MNQHSIFDDNFERQNLPRRRDIMPKWLRIYMWCIVVAGLLFFLYTAFFITGYDANDTMATDPNVGESYRSGSEIGKYIPSVIFSMMGISVWLEYRRAIRFNMIVAIVWIVYIAMMVMLSGFRALFLGIFLPVFIPYWIGLFSIQRIWEKNAVSGQGLF